MKNKKLTPKQLALQDMVAAGMKNPRIVDNTRDIKLRIQSTQVIHLGLCGI